MINLLECLSIKFKKNNKSCSFSKAARMSSIKFAFVKDYTHLSMYICKTHENISKDRSQETTHGCSINFIIKFTVKKKMSLWCSKKEKFFKFFLVMFTLGLWLKMRFIAISMVSWKEILVKRLVTSQETRNLLERFAFLIWEAKKKDLRKSNHQVLQVKEDSKYL